MRLLLLSFLLCFLTFSSTAQNTHGFGLNAGFTYNYRTALGSGSLFTKVPRLNYHLGLKYLHPLSGRISLETGLGFRAVGYGFKKQTLRWSSEPPVEFGGTGMIDLTLPHEVQVSNIHRFLELPLVLRWHLNHRTQRFILFGLANYVYLSTQERTVTDLSTEKKHFRDNRLHNFHLVTQLGLGWQWPLRNSGIEISVSPNFRFHLTSLNKERSVREHPYSGGVELGFWW